MYMGIISHMEYINQAINAIEAQDDTRVVCMFQSDRDKPIWRWYKMIFEWMYCY